MAKTEEELYKEKLAGLDKLKPKDTSGASRDAANLALDKLMNREKFSYDVNNDGLYQQYKDRYIQGGKLAMADTVGKASAMTGGYGNSYAQNAGQQAYQQYMTGLNDKITDLYQLALDKYNAEGDELKQNYALLADKADTEYGKYRDALGDWESERNYLTDRYDAARSLAYQKARDAYNENQDRIANNLKLGLDADGNALPVTETEAGGLTLEQKIKINDSLSEIEDRYIDNYETKLDSNTKAQKVKEITDTIGRLYPGNTDDEKVDKVKWGLPYLSDDDEIEKYLTGIIGSNPSQEIIDRLYDESPVFKAYMDNFKIDNPVKVPKKKGTSYGGGKISDYYADIIGDRGAGR